MASIDLPFLWLPVFRGKPYAYFRKGKLRVRLPLPDDPSFPEAYARVRAENERPKGRSLAAAEGSLKALILAYRSSPKWQELAPATRVDYDKALNPLDEHFGHLRVATLPPAFVHRLQDTYARKKVPDPSSTSGTKTVPTPRRANRMVTVFALLMAWGVRRGWRKDNPAARVEKLKTGPGYATWPDAAIKTFMASPNVQPEMKLALLLGVATGQRKQDCLAMSLAAYRDGCLELVPEKTKNSTGQRLVIPAHPDLREVLDKLVRDSKAGDRQATTILTRADGRPWQTDNFNAHFAAAVRAAGLKGYSFHGLRKTAATWLAEAGCSSLQIRSITGHASLSEVERYTAAASQMTHATAAIARISGRRIVE